MHPAIYCVAGFCYLAKKRKARMLRSRRNDAAITRTAASWVVPTAPTAGAASEDDFDANTATATAVPPRSFSAAGTGATTS